VTDVARTFEPLDVTADLQVTVDGREYAVTGHGERITVGASSFPDAIALARRVADASRAGLPLDGIGAELERGDLGIDIAVRGATVARVDPDRPGRAAELVGVPLRLEPAGIADALLR
jgi:hypothetical protein